MKQCWALPLANCSDSISREHLVSQCFFLSQTVKVMGHDWCKNTPKEIGLSSLTAKILCKKHNQDLSNLDSAAGEAFECFRDSDRLSSIRKAMKPILWHIQRYSINGLLLERWFLKTLINIQSTSSYPIGFNSNKAGMPSDELVKIAFGFSPFPEKCGLYCVIKQDEQIKTNETLEYAPLIKDNSFIGGALFRIRGFRFLLFITPNGPPSHLTGLGIGEEDWGDSQLNFHNKKIQFAIGKHTSHILVFNWPR